MAIILIPKPTATLLPEGPVYPRYARKWEREIVQKHHQAQRNGQIKRMDARRKIIAELIRRLGMAEQSIQSFEGHLLRYNHYDTRRLMDVVLRQERVLRDSLEQMVSIGRDIVENAGYSNPEEKEELAISLFPLLWLKLYSGEEMPRLAQCRIF